MRTKEIRSSRKKVILYLAASLGFVASGAFLIGDSRESNLALWGSLIFFALCAVVFVWLLIRPLRVILDRTGFLVAGGFVSSPKKVLWREIDGFFVYRLPRGGKMIGFNYKPGARERSMLLKISQQFGADGALPKCWPGSPEKMVEELNEYRAQALIAS